MRVAFPLLLACLGIHQDCVCKQLLVVQDVLELTDSLNILVGDVLVKSKLLPILLVLGDFVQELLIDVFKPRQGKVFTLSGLSVELLNDLPRPNRSLHLVLSMEVEVLLEILLLKQHNRSLLSDEFVESRVINDGSMVLLDLLLV